MPKEVNSTLSAEVKRVLTDKGDGFRPMSLNQAARVTGLSPGTVFNMAKGQVVNCESIIRFADAFGEDVTHWLRLTGYDDIAKKMRTDVAIEPGELDTMLEQIPVTYRQKAKEETRRFIEAIVLPRYNEAAA